MTPDLLEKKFNQAVEIMVGTPTSARLSELAEAASYNNEADEPEASSFLRFCVALCYIKVNGQSVIPEI